MPPLSKASLTLSACISLRSFFSHLPTISFSCLWSLSITISINALRSPRLISITFPLTGETNFNPGNVLSSKSTVPVFTASPTLTASLGLIPRNSLGITATFSGSPSSVTVLSAAPASLISYPRFNLNSPISDPDFTYHSLLI